LGKPEQNILVVTFVFKGVTLNKKMCLDYDSLKLPETSIFKRSGYMYGVVNYISARKKGLLK
jgi:hypothetical protein